jgi:hypothetical protein
MIRAILNYFRPDRGPTFGPCTFCGGIGKTPIHYDDDKYRTAWIESDDIPLRDWKICPCPICGGAGAFAH